ncbi:MAG: hypothetical protein M3178_06915 [Pseudomonadota bacterium]|nr:hypothetical protein [Pseudomonadota bacterium]
MVTKRTDRPRGRPNWDLLADRDRYLIASFLATHIVENQLMGDQKATRHAVAMTYAAIERGEMTGSLENLAAISRGEGKLKFRTTISRRQFEERPKGAPINARADDIRRKARRAMKSNYEWTEAMADAFGVAYYFPERECALTHARLDCLAVSEVDFFERSLKPFITGRFDPAKRVFFSLPDFMPNFV